MKLTLDAAQTIVSLNLEEARETAKYDHRTSEYWPTLIGERLWFLNMLNNIETEPKRGRWINGKCSECGCAPLRRVYQGGEVLYEEGFTYHFCPNCGAKMDLTE